MRTLFILLFPVLAWGQTYNVEMISIEDKFYTYEATFVVTDGDVTVINTDGTERVYTFLEPVNIKGGKAWRAVYDGRGFSVAVKDLSGDSKGLTVLNILNMKTQKSMAYVGRKAIEIGEY